MPYNALASMRAKNKSKSKSKADCGIDNLACTPDVPHAARNFGREALPFLREDCEGLTFDTADPTRMALEDADGQSAFPTAIPLNMEHDLSRLSFETATGRSFDSDSREDAFDIYYCYREIFKPFGAGNEISDLKCAFTLYTGLADEYPEKTDYAVKRDELAAKLLLLEK